MTQTKGVITLSEFQLGHIVGQYEGVLSQQKIGKNLLILLVAVNGVVVRYTREAKKCTASRSVCPGPSDRTMHLIKRNVEENPLCKAYDIAKTVEVCPRIAVGYLHKLGYYGRAARRKPLLRPTNIKQRKDWAHEMVERSLAFWMTVIFSDEAQLSLSLDRGRV